MKETRSIANGCLAKKAGADGRLFELLVVRELQLNQHLGEKVVFELNGETREGRLLCYDISGRL